MLYEITLYDTKDKFVKRYPCVPPFPIPPDVVVRGERYFVLGESLTYHEALGVHFLPEEDEHADPKPAAR